MKSSGALTRPSLAPLACLVALGAVLAPACGATERGSPVTSFDEAGIVPIAEGDSGAGTIPGQACAKMDILLVIDNSGSMQEEQANLAANFAVLTQKLDQFSSGGGAKLDYRIAVTTSGKTAQYIMKPKSPIAGFPDPPPMPANDVGDDGRFKRECSMSRPWLERDDPTLQNQFSCVTKVGTGGPGLEMPLEALRLAVTDRVADGSNAGFLRDDALLAVVILSDEDDCSRRDNNFEIADDNCPPGAPGYEQVADYVAAIDAVKGGHDRWAAAVVAGPVACTSSFGAAKEAVRLKEFAGKLGGNGVFSSICLGDLVSPLENALNVFNSACQKFTVK